MSMDMHVRKTLAGALLFSTSVLSGNATLIASAGALGVNWTSEALARIWQRERSALVPGTPVQRAATRAIRRAAEILKTLYQKQGSAHADLRAFELIRDCADAVSEPDSASTASLTSATVDTALGRALDSLLFGHDEKAVSFLKKELLSTVARTFREELAADSQAWQSFHGMLIEQLGKQFGTLSAVVERLPEVLARFAQQQNAQAALQGAAERLETLIAQIQQPHAATKAAASGISFENEDLDVGGSLQQAAGSIWEGQGATLPPEQRAGVAVTFSNKRVRVQGDAQQAAGNISKGLVPTGVSQGSAPSHTDAPSGSDEDKNPTRAK